MDHIRNHPGIDQGWKILDLTLYKEEPCGTFSIRNTTDTTGANAPGKDFMTNLHRLSNINSIFLLHYLIEISNFNYRLDKEQ